MVRTCFRRALRVRDPDSRRGDGEVVDGGEALRLEPRRVVVVEEAEGLRLRGARAVRHHGDRGAAGRADVVDGRPATLAEPRSPAAAPVARGGRDKVEHGVDLQRALR